MHFWAEICTSGWHRVERGKSGVSGRAEIPRIPDSARLPKSPISNVRSCGRAPHRGHALVLVNGVTQILSAIEQGHPDAAELLLLLVYAELRGPAAAKLTHEKTRQTLRVTAFVREACSK